MAGQSGGNQCRSDTHGQKLHTLPVDDLIQRVIYAWRHYRGRWRRVDDDVHSDAPGNDQTLPPAGAIRPSIGLDAWAYSFFGIRPARYASRPASQAYFIAYAVRHASCAPAIPACSST